MNSQLLKRRMKELYYVMEVMADDFFPGQVWYVTGNYDKWKVMTEEIQNIHDILIMGKTLAILNIL